MPSNLTVHNVSDLNHLTDTVAQRFIDVVNELHASKDVARVVLTGGTPGIGTLRELRSRASEIDWSRVHVFFGDERNVPVSHADSNEGQAREALLDHVDIPSSNIHGYRLGELSMEESVEAYKEILRTYAADGFDLHLLGMGPEGHVNTLFPHTTAVKERDALVVAEYNSPKPPAERVTLTLPAIERADRVWLLVAGAEKAEAASKVIERANPEDWPAAGARGKEETILFLAQDAAL